MKNIKVIFIIALPILIVFYVGMQLFIPLNIGNVQMEVKIPEGASYRQAINILSENNLIRDSKLFLLIGKVYGIDRRTRAGYYAFWGNMSPWQVFKKLADGKIIENEITIVEGDSIFEIGPELESNNIMSEETFSAFATDTSFLASLEIDAPSIEGYLFPQTYKFPKGARPESVLRLMVNKLRKEFNEEMKKRAEELGMSKNEVLTLASIIEREAVIDSERPLISAVFHNRLKKGMRLQADPTAIYGVRSFRYGVTRNDLRNRTDFNTYIIRGLPPGPIASPGIKSIEAALYPADVQYLFFVSRRDGTHYFSRTYSEHNAAIRRIREMQEAKLQQNSAGKESGT